ncbi:hypothetical protein NHQ30_006457 [Ciborinia camelliae]|nr:hypothetical protein NHQ30_006457 [Ciborinia camelliae]
MVKFTSSIALLLIAADSHKGNLDCTAVCSGARRQDSTSTVTSDHKLVFGTACNASGNYKCLTIFNVDGHVKCF